MPKPLEPPTFFLDRTIGKKIVAQALRGASLHVETHDDHFAQDAKDEEWLRVAGESKWVVVTNDRKIRYRSLELNCLQRSGVRAFAFAHGNLTGGEMAAVFLKALPKIIRILKRNKGPFIATLTRSGDVHLLSLLKS